jgi:hypothetical protein
MRKLVCQTCGSVIGYTANSFPFSSWCNEECAETITSTNEERDEVICELFLQGQGTRQIGRQFNVSYQNIQQILNRRGLTGTTEDHKSSGRKEKAAS